jgi:hypothetical protein
VGEGAGGGTACVRIARWPPLVWRRRFGAKLGVCDGALRIGAAEEPASASSSRGHVESGFERAKQEVGLDEYEVRQWGGWQRFITLGLLAQAFLAVQRAHAKRGAPA